MIFVVFMEILSSLHLLSYCHLVSSLMIHYSRMAFISIAFHKKQRQLTRHPPSKRCCGYSYRNTQGANTSMSPLRSLLGLFSCGLLVFFCIVRSLILWLLRLWIKCFMALDHSVLSCANLKISKHWKFALLYFCFPFHLIIGS